MTRRLMAAKQRRWSSWRRVEGSFTNKTDSGTLHTKAFLLVRPQSRLRPTSSRRSATFLMSFGSVRFMKSVSSLGPSQPPGSCSAFYSLGRVAWCVALLHVPLQVYLRLLALEDEQ